MTISAKIIADSVSPADIRLTTMQLRYPRFIHAELMTHRVFSRNASSSRAIPVERLIQDVLDDPALPEKWFKNKPGMQGTEEIVGSERQELIDAWLDARNNAVERARGMAAWGAHKQHINRVIEPFCHINVLVTATEWANFFALRDHKDAEPTFQRLARVMKTAMAESTPKLLRTGEWHLPYVETDDYIALNAMIGAEVTDRKAVGIPMAQKISVARCARVSYLTQDGRQPSIEEDLKLYERLVGSAPLHASPAEHQATPDKKSTSTWHEGYDWEKSDLHGNFHGWIQYRKTLPGENAGA